MDPTNRRLAPLALVAVLVLAGCGGVVGDGTPDPVTPAPVPTTEQPVAPGITGDAIDVDQVVERHERALAETTYTTVERLRAAVGGGASVAIRNLSIQSAPDGALRYVRQEPPVEGNVTQINRSQIWSDGNRTVYRFTNTAGQTYTEDSAYPASLDAARSARIEAILEDVSVTSAVRRTDGSVELSGRLTNASAVPTTRNFQHHANGSVSAQVSEDGVVRRLALRYDAVYRGDRVPVRYVVGVEKVGSTTVERPQWVDF